jgi:hypothetical protein
MKGSAAATKGDSIIGLVIAEQGGSVKRADRRAALVSGQLPKGRVRWIY